MMFLLLLGCFFLAGTQAQVEIPSSIEGHSIAVANIIKANQLTAVLVEDPHCHACSRYYADIQLAFAPLNDTMQSTLIKIDTDSEFVEAENLFIHDPEEPTIVVYEGAQDPAVYEGPLEAHAILEWLKQTIDDPMLQLYVKQLEPTEFVQWARQTTSATYALACTRW